MEEIQAIEVETNEVEAEDEDQTLVTLDVRELLVIQRALHGQKASCEPSQGSRSFIADVLLEARCVS